MMKSVLAKKRTHKKTILKGTRYLIQYLLLLLFADVFGRVPLVLSLTLRFFTCL